MPYQLQQRLPAAPTSTQQQVQAMLQSGHRACLHRGTLPCYARRTVSGGSDTTTSTKKTSPINRPDSKSSSSSSSSNGASQSPHVTAKRPASRQHSNGRRSNSSSSDKGTQGRGQRQVNKPSRLEDFMRNTPGFNRFLDGTLILGDAVMVLATELSSERISLEQIPTLGGVAVASWILAGALLGDYMAEPDPDANPLSDALGWPVFAAVVNAMITWAVCMVVSIFGFSWLVSNFIVEPEMVLEVARDGMLSPQLEISVALLITMSCWRGMAARLRL